MYKILRKSSENKIGIIFKVDVESRDFDTLLPFLERELQMKESLRILVDLKDVTNTDLLSIFKVVVFHFRYNSSLEKQALVTDNISVIRLANVMSFLTRKEIRCFPTYNHEQAWEWIEK